MTTKWEKKDDALIVKADETSIGINEARKYLAEIKNQTERYTFLIFDFSNVTEITPTALRSLTFAISIASQVNAKVSMVGPNVVKECITGCNLDKVFPYYSSIDQVLSSASPTTLFNQTLKDELDDTIKTTFQNITGTEVLSLPFDGKTQNHSNNFEIGAIIGIIDKSFKGTLILGFSVKSYLKLMSKMFGTEYNEINSEISDGPAEVLNMIFGQFKIALNNQGFEVSPAIPTTIMGSNLRIVPSEKMSSSIVLLYESEFGAFYFELATNYQSQKAVA